jgi:HNH endonuclease
MKAGIRFGKLLTKKKICGSTKNPRTYARWLCKCDCGGEKIVNESSLYGGHTTSCGCLQNLNDKEYNEKTKLRLQKNIEIDEKNCWIWCAGKHKQGYGQVGIRGKSQLVHRITWEIYKGKIPEGMKVCHKCDVTSCCNPDHLFLGTQNDNVKDGIGKGRYKNRDISKNRRNKLNFLQVQEIKKLHEEGMTRKELEKMFNVGQTCIAKILCGISWKINWTEEL